MIKTAGVAGSPKSGQPTPGREPKGAARRLCDRFYKDKRFIMRRITLILLIILLWTTGCSTADTEPTLEAVAPTETAVPTVTTEPTATTVPPTPTEEVPATSEPETAVEPVIILKRSGGFAGLEDQWIIYADGRVVGSEAKNNPLSTEHIAQILADAEAGGFFDLKGEYIDEGHCCDFFNYEVTLTLPDGRSKTITTVEQTPSQPEILAQTILELNFLLFQ